MVSEQAARIARRLETENLGAADLTRVRGVVSPEVSGARPALVQVYRVVPGPDGGAMVVPVVDVAAPTIPQGWARASADRLASQAAAGAEPAPWMLEPITDGGELLRVAHPRPQRRRDGGRRGRVGVSGGQPRRTVAADDAGLRGLQPAARAASAARRRLRVVLRDGDAVHPGRRDLAGAVPREADHAAGPGAVASPRARLAPATTTIAFSSRPRTSSARWSRRSTPWRRKWRRAAAGWSEPSVDLQRKHEEGESRRRYIEAMVERIATGVVSIDRAGRIGTINSAAIRLLELEAERHRAARRRRVLARGPRAGQRAARAVGAGAHRRPGAGDRAGARRPRAPPGGRRHPHPGRGRRLRRHGAGGRRRHAADPRAEGGGLARGGAAPGARDQEPADADPALRRAHAAEAERSGAAAPGAGAGVHVDDHRRGRVAQGAGRRVLAVRAHAGAAGGADRPAPG